MARKININKDILYSKYILEEKSTIEVGKELGCSPFTITKYLKEFGFKIRDKSEAQKIKYNREGVHNEFELNIETLKKLYLEEMLTTYEIAKNLGVSQYKVWKTLKKICVTRNISETTKGRTPWNKGGKGLQQHSEETKCKIRLKTIKRIEDSIKDGGQLYPAYNKSSIKHIENFGLKNGYNFKHAENGGEFYIEKLGYWVDGYDEVKNVVLEFDEKHHNLQKDKDYKRQMEIINHLKCRFIRIKEIGKEILEIDYYGEKN